jgi:hypothetical protein
MIRKSLGYLFVLTAFVAMNYYWHYREQRLIRQNEEECPSHLNILGYWIHEAKAANRGRYPPSLNFLNDVYSKRSGIYKNRAHPALCPKSDRALNLQEDCSVWSDYYYIDWSNVFGTNKVPDGFPIAYDKRFNNHQSGVFILEASENVVWDEGGLWLLKFIQTNSFLKLPPPERDASAEK